MTLAGIAGFFALAPPPNIQFYLRDPEISNLERAEILPTFPTGVLFMLVLPVIVLVFTWFLFDRTWRDLHHAVLGALTGIVFSFFTCAFLWYTVGGLRPNFLEVCDPDPAKVSETEEVQFSLLLSKFTIFLYFTNHLFSFQQFTMAEKFAEEMKVIYFSLLEVYHQDMQPLP